MRILAAAAAILVLVASPSYAQMGAGKRPRGDESKKTEDNKPKVDDKAYQEALKRIPDPKEKYDPWAVTKTPDADKKPSK